MAARRGTVEHGGTAGNPTLPTETPSMISDIILPPNTNTSGNNFAEIPLGRRISGMVFLDYNNDGLFNGSDYGIGSQTINLSGTDINDNAINLSVTTNPDGTYDFLNLPEGTYTVTQPNQPTGTTNGITTPGTTGGTATGVLVTPSVISGISLIGVNVSSLNNNFAEQPGAAPDLTLTKTHYPSCFACSGTDAYFTITPANIGTQATSGTVTIIDTLPDGLTPTAAAGTGWSCSIGGQIVTCTTSSVIPGGASGENIIINVAVGSGLAGQILVNTAVISGGGEPEEFTGNNTATDSVPIANIVSLRGTVWLDVNHNRIPEAGERRLAGWIVELYLNGSIVDITSTAADGTYSFSTSPGSGYRVVFREPASGATFAYPVPNESGSSFDDGVVSPANPSGADTSDGTLSSMTLVLGSNYSGHSLPVDPGGVVYDAVTRFPVSDATVSLSGPGGFVPATHLVGGAANATQVTGPDGFYQFFLLSGAPSGEYIISVVSPVGYNPGVSTIIPPTAGPYVVPGSGIAAIQAQPTPPTGAQPTTYYLSFTMSGTSADVVNNHIPIDPLGVGGDIIVTKITPLVNVKRGDLVPYTITATNASPETLVNIDVRDIIPPGFKYRKGSATLNKLKSEPVVDGRMLIWPNLTFAPEEKKTFTMLLVVGSGVGEGEYTNQVYAANSLSSVTVSNVATATVRVIPDPTFDCTDIIGKVFDDKNANGYQDEGELGIANVRLATARGLIVTTDAHGRFHIPCASVPHADRGSNFIMKVDERTLPSGYRMTTENPYTVRATRGKMIKMNFGAAIHRVVRIDVTDAAFEPGSENLRSEWQEKMQALEKTLRESPTVVRLAYRMNKDSKSLVKKRIKAMRKMLTEIWKKGENCPPLIFEEEIVEAKQ